jgi:hypothetical protein
MMELPSKNRAWLESRDPELFMYYGWGMVLNDAQIESLHAVLQWPPGTVHLWRWANRTGKTTGLVGLHLLHAWYKLRYENPDLDSWIDFKYRTLHSAPLNRLTGKAWELADALISGSAIQQRSPVTHRQRPALLAPFFQARAGRAKDGSDLLEVNCHNGSVIDFMSTQGGAGRLESETWWFIDWDEFARQQPIDDVPLLFDQTFLPRSSDFMAPLVLSSTVTDDSEPIYQELEDIAGESPQDWNVMAFGRSANFSQSQESIDRQKRMSIDPAIAARSVEGGIGMGGKGTLFAPIALKSAFDPKLPTEYSDAQIEHLAARGRIAISSFDHAATGDLNVVTTWSVPWPIPREEDQLIGSVIGIGLAERRSGSHLTAELQAQFALDEVERFGSRFIIVDGTAEGGQLAFRAIREEYPDGAIDCSFNKKEVGYNARNKDMGLQALQRQFAMGLPEIAHGEGWIDGWPDAAPGTFGMYRLPFAGRWLKVHRELAVLRRDDQHQRQDREMTVVQVAWYLEKFVHSVRSIATPFSIVGRKPRQRRRKRGPVAIVR